MQYFSKFQKMLRLLMLCAVFSAVMPLEVTSNEFASGMSLFSSDLFEESVKSTKSNENVIISPFSIATALSLLSQATNGRTFDQMKNGFHLSSLSKSLIADDYLKQYEALKTGAGDASFSIANRIYVQENFKINKKYQEIAKDKFESGVETVNFANAEAAANTINHFVEEKTNGKIKDLFTANSLSTDSRVVAVNAIHFKGEWERKFYETETNKQDFYMNDAEKISVDFMNIDTYFNYAEISDAKVLQLKYKNSNFSMVFILPNQRTGFTAMQPKLKNLNLGSIINGMKERKVDVSIPKFTVEFQMNLNDALMNLGMTDMFADNADLSDLLETGERLKVSDVIHKAFITVSEGGTEAAAATGYRLVPMSLTLNAPTFHADHPFFYYIWDNNSETVVFAGQITKFEA